MDHLSPDVLAAWMDGTLTAAERSAAEAHASDCAHCQAMLAAMARTAPVPARRAWWSMPAVRWLVPIAAALVVVAVWIGGQRTGTDREEAKMARTEAAPAAAAAEPAPPATDAFSAAEKAGARDATLQAKADTRASKDEARSKGAVGGAVGGIAAGNEGFADKKRIDALAPPAAPLETPRAPAAAAGTAQPVAEPQALVATTPPSLPDTAVPVPSPPPAPARTPPPPAPLPVQEAVTVTSESSLNKMAARGGAAARTRTVDVISPERAFRWRALEPGSVQYSMDSGISWRPSSTGTSVVLHAGSAPSRNVCWMVGQAGTVVLTIDGLTWQVRPFPERVDLTDVRATDARNATVTTADSRRFATSDGGATWSPLQEN